MDLAAPVAPSDAPQAREKDSRKTTVALAAPAMNPTAFATGDPCSLH